MKKRFIAMLVTIVGAIVCALGLIACSGDGADNGKKVLWLVLADGNGAEYHSGLRYIGDIVYGSEPDLDSFKLYAEYTDGSRTELDKTAGGVSVRYIYNMDKVDTLPEFFDVGVYMIIYSYKNSEVGIMFKILTSPSSTPYELVLDKTTWKNQEEPVVAVVKDGEPILKRIYQVFCIDEEKYDQVKDAEDLGVKLLQYGEEFDYLTTGPGTYYFFAYIRSNEYYFSTLKKATIE